MQSFKGQKFPSRGYKVKRAKGVAILNRIKALELENPDHPEVVAFRKCEREKCRRYRTNPEIQSRLYAYSAAWNKANPEKVKAYRQSAKTPEKRKIRNDGARKIYRSNISHRLEMCLRSRIVKALRSMARGVSVKAGSAFDIIGEDVSTVRRYLESKFQPGMSWKNYGQFGWHVDHIIPLSAFDLNNPEAQQEAFSLRNLQPLWAEDNLRKHNKINYPLPVSRYGNGSLKFAN